MNDQAIEQEIQDKGLTAPRVTPADIDSLMSHVTYYCHVVPGTTTTVCTAIDKDGFTLATGVSACASPENFNVELGEKIAKQNAERNALEELWKLEGYALKKRLVEAD
ncbi:Gp49 family protein [Halomonas sp. LS-001]